VEKRDSLSGLVGGGHLFYLGGMFPALTRPLDRLAIRTACRSVASGPPRKSPTASRKAVEHPDYFSDLPPGGPLEFYEGDYFTYGSPVTTPLVENNTVYGRLFRGRSKRKTQAEGKGPAVVFLHGWNGEQGYRYLFPLMGRRFASLGLTVAMIELPYHGSRKPKSGGLRNFLSGDLEHMMDATRQAVADIRAMVGWLDQQGYGPVGLWGVSLGSWLGGLVACADSRVASAVLVTPVPRIDEAIQSLNFCRHIRASMEGTSLSAESLNLASHRPLLPPDRILLVQSLYDLFASRSSVEELLVAWNHPEIWRVRHGHISVLFSAPIMERTGRWLRRKLAEPAG
jgi:pimeloyl-ACP methyl ester carboxylesterase